MIESSDDPGESETQEDVDGVRTGDVSDGVVGVLLVGRSSLAREGVRQRRAQGHKSDGCNNIFFLFCPKH